jgi:hypothetical protein
VGPAIILGVVLVLTIAGLVFYSGRQADRVTGHAPTPDTAVAAPSATPVAAPADAATNTQLTVDSKPTPDPAPMPSPAPETRSDLTGTWVGSYMDQSGSERLQLLDLQMQQDPDGAITGRFTYKAGSAAGAECTLEKSSYSTQSKRLRLITHCRNPDHPKFLNVPLEFADVDPGSTTIEGGRLAFHLADDVAVTLKRTKGM